MNIPESCLPAPSGAYPLIREAREAGARSVVEWEGDSWACVWGRNIIVPGGESPGSTARGGDGWSEGLCQGLQLCQLTLATPCISRAQGLAGECQKWDRSLRVGDQKHTCLPVYIPTCPWVTFQDIALLSQAQAI